MNTRRGPTWLVIRDMHIHTRVRYGFLLLWCLEASAAFITLLNDYVWIILEINFLYFLWNFGPNKLARVAFSPSRVRMLIRVCRAQSSWKQTQRPLGTWEAAAADPLQLCSSISQRLSGRVLLSSRKGSACCAGVTFHEHLLPSGQDCPGSRG